VQKHGKEKLEKFLAMDVGVPEYTFLPAHLKRNQEHGFSAKDRNDHAVLLVQHLFMKAFNEPMLLELHR
jgi:hypothetical protein